MSGGKRVAVHIVTYNSAADIESCLDAVLRQSYPIAEIRVVDNASSDDTLERLRGYGERVSVTANRENNGFAGGHNQLLRQGDSDYYLILNPDAILDPDYVRHLVACLEQRSHVGSATGMLLFQNAPHLVDSAGLTIKKSRRAFDRGAGEPAERYATPAEVFGVSGAAAFYRGEMVRAISCDGEFFDESFFAYKEDVDVAWRAQLLGWSAWYEPQAVAWHKRGWKKSNRSKQPAFIRRHSYINRYRMILKNDRWRDWLRHLPAILPYEIAALGYSLLREPDLLPAWGSLIRDLPGLLDKRKWIHKRKQSGARHVCRYFE